MHDLTSSWFSSLHRHPEAAMTMLTNLRHTSRMIQWFAVWYLWYDKRLLMLPFIYTYATVICIFSQTVPVVDALFLRVTDEQGEDASAHAAMASVAGAEIFFLPFSSAHLPYVMVTVAATLCSLYIANDFFIDKSWAFGFLFRAFAVCFFCLMCVFVLVLRWMYTTELVLFCVTTFLLVRYSFGYLHMHP